MRPCSEGAGAREERVVAVRARAHGARETERRDRRAEDHEGVAARLGALEDRDRRERRDERERVSEPRVAQRDAERERRGNRGDSREDRGQPHHELADRPEERDRQPDRERHRHMVRGNGVRAERDAGSFERE